MIRTRWTTRALASWIIAGAICANAHALDQAQEQNQIDQWRKQRIARLTAPDGWLTLVGLYWLNEGKNTFGRDARSTLVLEHAAAPRSLGTFEVHDRNVKFIAQRGVRITLDGKPIQSIAMRADTSGEPTVLASGSIEFFVIERAGKLGVRVRDTEHSARKQFRGIEYFPVEVDWVLDAKFEPYNPVKHIEIVNVLGMTDQMVSPGAVVFSKNGKDYRLDAILEEPEDKELFVMFADTTSAHETYGAGRFLYIPMPSNGRTTIDFNKAYNPPCAFSDFATCPLPPWQNRLALRVDAGEKKYVRPGH